MARIYTVRKTLFDWVERNDDIWDYLLEDLDEAINNNEVLLYCRKRDRVLEAPSYLIEIIDALEEKGYVFDYSIGDQVLLLDTKFGIWDGLEYNHRITFQLDIINKEVIIGIDNKLYSIIELKNPAQFIKINVDEDMLCIVALNMLKKYEGGKR